MSAAVSALAPAKLNLTLRVGPRRDDGYHEIESLIVPIELFDGVRVSPAPNGELRLTCSDPGLPDDESNLALRAARVLAQYAESPRGATIHLEKRIPAGAGLGGGSSNAATTLSVLNEMWQIGATRDELAALAAQIGSDVPLFLRGGPVIARGRGERLEPLDLRVNGHAVVVLSGLSCSTSAVYRRFDELSPPPPRISCGYFAAGVTSIVDLLHGAYNDLEPAAMSHQPGLARLWRELMTRTQATFRLSGSGCALYTLMSEPDAARSLAQSIAATFPVRVEVARLITRHLS